MRIEGCMVAVAKRVGPALALLLIRVAELHRDVLQALLPLIQLEIVGGSLYLLRGLSYYRHLILVGWLGVWLVLFQSHPEALLY